MSEIEVLRILDGFFINILGKIENVSVGIFSFLVLQSPYHHSVVVVDVMEAYEFQGDCASCHHQILSWERMREDSPADNQGVSKS
jgi:hypothetical protein